MGSIIQAAVLLKQGVYGKLRYMIPLFPEASIYFTPFIITLSIIAIIYISLACLAQLDMKKIIAYSSIGHTNIIVLGLFSADLNGIIGSVYFKISHGQISSGLFLLIGILYDRYHTRQVKYYTGLVNQMPLFVVLFLFFTMANIAVPGTSGFISEFQIFIGVYHINNIILLLAGQAIILTPCYAL